MIYQRIKELCKINGISINALEDKLGISRGSLCKIDKHKPSSEKLRMIANELNTTSDFLLTGEKKESTFTPESAHIVAKLRNDEELVKALEKYFRLSDDKKKHVIDTINMLSEQ